MFDSTENAIRNFLGCWTHRVRKFSKWLWISRSVLFEDVLCTLGCCLFPGIFVGLRQTKCFHTTHRFHALCLLIGVFQQFAWEDKRKRQGLCNIQDYGLSWAVGIWNWKGCSYWVVGQLMLNVGILSKTSILKELHLYYNISGNLTFLMLLVYLFWVLEWIPNLKAKLKQCLQSMINLIRASQIPFERSMNFQLFSEAWNYFDIKEKSSTIDTMGETLAAKHICLIGNTKNISAQMEPTLGTASTVITCFDEHGKTRLSLPGSWRSMIIISRMKTAGMWREENFPVGFI